MEEVHMIFIVVTLALLSSAHGGPLLQEGPRHKADILVRKARSTGCTARSTDNLHQDWVNYHSSLDFHPSYHMIPSWESQISDHLQKSTKNSTYYVSGDRDVDCNAAQQAFTADSPLQNRANCPWYNIINSDPNRYPSNLIEAECNCDDCIGVSPDSHGCERMYYNVPVLRRTGLCHPDTNEYQWENGWQRIAVGCTCAKIPSV